MDIDWKTVNAAIVAGVPACIVAIGAFLTAKLVTYRLERQKQHMELYKTLYIERVVVAKQLSELVGVFYQLCMNLRVAGNRVEVTGKLDERNIELSNLVNTNRWLLTTEVCDASEAFRSRAISIYSSDGPLPQNTYPALGENLHALSITISDMMLRDDLSHLVAKSPLTSSGKHT